MGVAAALNSTCYALTANGSFGFSSIGGLITYVPGGGLMINASSITIPIPNATTNCGISGNICEQITSIAPTYLGVQNDFAAGGHTPLNVADSITFNSYTFDLSFGALPTFNFTVQDGSRFRFVATSGSKQSSTIGGSDFLNVAYLGTFHDTLGLYVDAAASLSLTFTQTGGSTGPVTYAGSFASPPMASPGVPEPETLGLVGCALVGIGLVGRKKIIRQ
jgi:hypothetical protein